MITLSRLTPRRLFVTMNWVGSWNELNLIEPNQMYIMVATLSLTVVTFTSFFGFHCQYKACFNDPLCLPKMRSLLLVHIEVCVHSDDFYGEHCDFETIRQMPKYVIARNPANMRNVNSLQRDRSTQPLLRRSIIRSPTMQTLGSQHV